MASSIFSGENQLITDAEKNWMALHAQDCPPSLKGLVFGSEFKRWHLSLSLEDSALEEIVEELFLFDSL